MSVSRIAYRYARSLIELAEEGKKLDPVLKDMEMLQVLLRNRDLRNLLRSPVIDVDKKSRILDQVLGGRVDTLTMKFVMLLLKKQREPFLKDIIDSFIEQYKEIRNIHELNIRTARELSEAEIEQLLQKLRDLGVFLEGTVEIDQKVDEDLIGGFILEYRDFIYDATVSNQLDTMRRKQFQGNLYRSMIRAR
jgi:F-type H+-transporting ATPase subunit delta